MGIHKWKRFGPRNAYQSLHLDGYVHCGYIYEQDPGEKKKLENQQLNNVGHSGAWRKFYGGPKDTRGFRWTAKATPPVRTSFDQFVDNWDRCVHSQSTIPG